MGGFLAGLSKSLAKGIDDRNQREQDEKKQQRDFNIKIYTDPNTPESVRQKALKDIQSSLNPEARKHFGRISDVLAKFHQKQKQGQPQQQQTPSPNGKLQPPTAAQQPPSSQPAAASPPQPSNGPLQPPASAQSPPNGGAAGPLQPPTSAQQQPAEDLTPNQSTFRWQEQEEEKVKQAERERRSKMVASDDTLSAREKVEFIETGHMPTVPAKEKPTKLDLLKQAEEWKKSDDPEMRAAGESFINANAPKPTNMKEEWVMRPGSDKPERAFVDPKKPGGYFDVNNQPLPEGTQAVATPVQQRMYGAVQGYYYYFLGQGLSDKEAREKAGAMFVEREGVHLGRVEQQAAIDSALSGVGLGPGFSSAAKSGGAPAAKTSTSPVSSIPSTPKATTPKNPARPEGPSQEDTDNINIYLSSLFGNTKSTNKASQVRQQAGMKALAKASGLSPTEFQTAAAVAQDKVKALGETVERYGAMVRLTDVMDVVGDTVIDTAKKAIKSDSPLANQAWRTIELKSVGDPATREFLLTLNDFARHYATLTAGGALSRAMLPVSVKDDVDNLISPNMTLKEAVAVVDRIKKQAKSEKQGYQNAIKDLGGEIKSSLPGPSPKNKLEPPSGAPTDLKGKSTEELLKMLGGGGAG